MTRKKRQPSQRQRRWLLPEEFEQEMQALAEEYADVLSSRSAFGLRVALGLVKYEPEAAPSQRKKE